MMAPTTKSSYALTSAALCAWIAHAGASTIAVPVVQSLADVDPVQHAVHTLNKHGLRTSSAALPTAPEALDAGFWFGSFNVGLGKNLSLLIDTGSSDVGIDPGLYKPSSSSKKLSAGGDYNYITVLENGCGESNISYQGYSDTVSFQGLTATNQGLYSIKKQPAAPGTVTQIYHDGIVGFSGTSQDEFGTPFFYNLCQQKQVQSCRFGLAFNTNGTGRHILGGIDSTAYNGSLTRVPVQQQWYGTGNVVTKGKTLFNGVTIVFDSGTAGIVAPVSQVKAYFKAAGIQAVNTNAPGCVGGVFGYYQCNNPPNLGFALGSNNAVFNIEPSAMKLQDNGNNNCTVWVTGLSDDSLPDNFWIVGQNWMQGKYVDFDYASNSIGVAPLKK